MCRAPVPNGKAPPSQRRRRPCRRRLASAFRVQRGAESMIAGGESRERYRSTSAQRAAAALCAAPALRAPRRLRKPFPGATQTVLEADARAEAELAVDVLDRRLRMADVAGPRSDVAARQCMADQALEYGDDVEQRVALVARDVEDRSADPRRGERQAVGVHHVVDVREVARLLAVAVDLQRLPIEGRAHEE